LNNCVPRAETEYFQSKCRPKDAQFVSDIWHGKNSFWFLPKAYARYLLFIPNKKPPRDRAAVFY